jgi:hypothetical protein
MHNKQLLTLNHGFHEWCHSIEGIQHERTMDFEHRYFMMMMMCVLRTTTQLDKPHHTRPPLPLPPYNFTLSWRTSTKVIKCDLAFDVAHFYVLNQRRTLLLMWCIFMFSTKERCCIFNFGINFGKQ